MQLSVTCGSAQLTTCSVLKMVSSHRIVGGSVSTTTMLSGQNAELPASSVAVYSSVVLPSGKVSTLLSPVLSVCVSVAVPQRSLAVGMVKLTAASQLAVLACTTLFGGQTMLGAMVSSTVMLKLQVVAFPLLSMLGYSM